jgi:hypothetical protein
MNSRALLGEDDEGIMPGVGLSIKGGKIVETMNVLDKGQRKFAPFLYPQVGAPCRPYQKSPLSG